MIGVSVIREINHVFGMGGVGVLERRPVATIKLEYSNLYTTLTEYPKLHRLGYCHHRKTMIGYARKSCTSSLR